MTKCSNLLWCYVLQLEQALKLSSGEISSDEVGQKSLVQQNIELRKKLDEEHSNYKRKLQAYQDGQQRQAQLVQKLQAKVHLIIHYISLLCYNVLFYGIIYFCIVYLKICMLPIDFVNLSFFQDQSCR